MRDFWKAGDKRQTGGHEEGLGRKRREEEEEDVALKAHM